MAGLIGQAVPLTIRVTGPRWRVPVVAAGAVCVCVCVAILFTPTGVRAASFTWSSPTLVGARTSPIPSVSCATMTLCVAVSGDDVYTATAPADDRWTAATIDASAPLDLVSCWNFNQSQAQCAAIDAEGYVFGSQDPAEGADTWVRSEYSIDNPAENVGGAEITGLSCGDEGWCVAVDARGSVLTQYQGPIGGWHTTEYVGQPGGLTAVSCTPTVCLAANGDGRLWTNKATQGGAWTALTSVRAGHGVSSVSCTGGLCVLTSPRETTTDPAFNPFGGASAWSVHWNSNPATYPQPAAVSCAAVTLCVGVNEAPLSAGIAIVSTSPRWPGSFTGPVATDQTIDAPGSGPLDAISCVSNSARVGGAQLCAVSDDTGHMITGTIPETDSTAAAG